MVGAANKHSYCLITIIFAGYLIQMRFFRLITLSVFLLLGACTPEVKTELTGDHKPKKTTYFKQLTIQDSIAIATIAVEPQKKPIIAVTKKSQTTLDRFEAIGTLIERNLTTLHPLPAPGEKKFGKKKIRLSQNDHYQTLNSLNRYLILRFDNDILAEADYYYTNGISIGMIHPVLQFFPVNKLLPSLGKHAMMYNGLTINHKMYTPRNPEATEIDPDDRPFAGTFYAEFFKISLLPAKKLKLYLGIKLGMIGKASFASTLQKTIHNLDPTGWQFQVSNDFIINLDGSLSKTIFSNSLFEWQTGLSMGIGTYNNYGGLETEIRIGRFAHSDQVFYTARKNTIESSFATSWQYWWYLRPAVKYVLYDATLNGGVFNQESPHRFSTTAIHHEVFMLETGVTMFFKHHGIGLKYVGISPEFKTGSSHLWGGFSYIYNF